MKKNTILLKLSLILVSNLIFSQKEVVFYQSAHPDDWQLFMNPDVFNTVRDADKKTVIVHLTAGDAGLGVTTSYYQAREEGVRRSVRFMKNAFNYGQGSNMNDQMVVLNGHSVRRCDYGGIVLYLLRLPDGNYGGGGFPGTGNQSLVDLYTQNKPISAIDNTTTYQSKTDLHETLKALVLSEVGANDTKTFCVSDTNTSINPGDHSDHLTSSRFFQDVANDLKDVKLKLYIDYHTANLDKNVFDDDLFADLGTWGATTSGLGDIGGCDTTWEPGHNRWLARQYSRTSYSVRDNIALNKPTTSSGYESSNNASDKANDGNFNTFWANNPYAQWWQVDLLKNYDVNGLRIVNYSDGSRYYKYNIQGSLDGKNWYQLVDNSKNTNVATNDGDYFDISPEKVRYIRVNMLYNSKNIGVHIVEFEAYGKENLSTLDNNIALKKVVETSGNESGSKNIYINDGNQSTMWANNPYTTPQWAIIDLGKNYNVNKINVLNYVGNNRYYQYKLYTSLDKVNWEQIAYKNDTSIATNTGDDYAVSNKLARFVKVEMLFNSANVGIHVRELSVFGSPEIINITNLASRTLSNANFKDAEEKDFAFKNPIKQGEKLDLKNNDEIDTFSIYDLNGKSVREYHSLPENSSISTDGLMPGNYLLKKNNDKKFGRLIRVC